MIEKTAYRHSFEVQEIVGKAPSWTVRWGISAILGVAVLLLILSAFITYPEEARLPVSIRSDTPCRYIVHGQDEQITLTRSGGKVSARDTIAILVTQGGDRHPLVAGLTGVLVPLASADTPAVVIPPRAGYSFTGMLPGGLIKQHSQTLAVTLLVQQPDAAGNALTLHGQLTGVAPAINGQSACRGLLDSLSDRQLANENAFTSSCRGTLEIRLSEKSLFSVLLKNTFGL